MFCPKCGTVFEDGSLKCEKCGYEIVNAPEPVDHSEPPVPNSAPLDEKKPKASLKRFSVPQIVLFVMAALILIISLYAAGRVVSGGMSMLNRFPYRLCPQDIPIRAIQLYSKRICLL